ncbi:hypothetical protein Hypma_009561 [Hypsizygus marmoreus]|uniref:Uncharacterized protein n=1 Tax=Hypsizygus marmoreus TaxID=39966 RepID=A0A369JVB4_HYPMA|nr:hypothetical protein Hypma_009561 [Hypsizygus marmoreus]
MATPTSTQRPSPSSGSAGPSVPPRWARTGEPGSAFSGLSRGSRGRGSGRGRGGRGGRGGARETKPAGSDPGGDKTDTAAKNSSTPVTKPATLPTSSGNEKPSSTPNTSSTRPKGSRRASRTIPAIAVPQVNGTADVPSSPSTSRPQNRRRRSQSGKGPVAVLSKIHVPPHDDNLLRPQRNRLGAGPYSAPIKDAPPHLAGTFDMRNNIDALVERVRAVAMADNRPTTPGSHIDWAGDDDDSLPDLDDWGVTPATGVGVKAGLISPIVVDGLKSLPDVDAKPLTPLAHAADLPNQTAVLEPRKNDEGFGISFNQDIPAPCQPGHEEKDQDSFPLSTESATKAVFHLQQVPLPSAHTSAEAVFHRSLSAKPAVPSVNIAAKISQDLTATAMHKAPLPKAASVTVEAPSPIATPTDQSAGHAEPGAQTSVERTSSEPGLFQSIHSPSKQDMMKPDPFENYDSRGGLTASIHAPATLLESVSAPSHISTHTSTNIENRTHIRSHTVGRPPSFPTPEHNTRPSRSGHNTPRGALATGGYHTRTHSSPPAGAILNNHRSPTHRPVITGDAISRLARTIGSATLTPARAASVTTHD